MSQMLAPFPPTVNAPPRALSWVTALQLSVHCFAEL